MAAKKERHLRQQPVAEAASEVLDDSTPVGDAAAMPAANQPAQAEEATAAPVALEASHGAASAAAAATAAAAAGAWKAPFLRQKVIPEINLLVMMKGRLGSLDRDLQQLYSSSTCSRRFLTPREFGQRYGATQHVWDKVFNCFYNDPELASLGWDVLNTTSRLFMLVAVGTTPEDMEIGRRCYKRCTQQFGKYMVDIGQYVTDADSSGISTSGNGGGGGSRRRLLSSVAQQLLDNQQQQQQQTWQRRPRQAARGAGNAHEVPAPPEAPAAAAITKEATPTRRHLQQASASASRAASQYLTASQLAAVYSLPTDEFDGRGVNIIVPTYERVQDTDVWLYLNQSEPPIPYSAGESYYSGTLLDPKEEGLDPTETLVNLQLMLAVAPKAKVQYHIGEPSDLGEILLLTLVANNVVWDKLVDGNATKQAHIILYTWQREERPTDASHPLNVILKQMAMQGMTFVTASGNCGARGFATSGNATCADASSSSSSSSRVGFPQNLPYALSVGGTTVDYSTDSYWLAEKAWSDSGGGTSSSVQLPWWQQGVAGLVSSTRRNLPDVALSADLDQHPYVFVRAEVTGRTGGTTAAASVWAGFFALVNQCRRRYAAASCRNSSSLGFPAPDLYRLAALQANSSSIIPAADRAFHDVTRGGNGRFQAGPGWDAVTGWGSMHGRNLLAALCPGYRPPEAAVYGACCQRNRWTGAPHCFTASQSTCTAQGGVAFHAGKSCKGAAAGSSDAAGSSGVVDQAAASYDGQGASLCS